MRKITIDLDRTRELSFSWAAIDYLLDKYGDVSKPMILMAEITGNPASINKERLNALFDVFTALFLADDNKMTPKKVKEIMPFDQISDFIIKASNAIADGQSQGSENPQTPTE
jgi:hypothetical protein